MNVTFKSLTNNLIHYATIVFSLLWIALIVVDYLYFHPKYLLSLKNFQYYDLLLILSLIGLLVGYLVIRLAPKNKQFQIVCNGSGILLLLLVMAAIIIPIHFQKVASSENIYLLDVCSYLSKILVVLAGTYFIYLVCYVIGNTIFKNIFSIRLSYVEECLLSIAIGILVTCIFLFILAAFHFLNFIFVWPYFLLPPLLFYKKSFTFIRTTLFTSVLKNNSSINWLGFGSFFLTLLFICLSYLQNIRPLPFGFDALRLYLNLPKLLYEQQGLIEGHAAYYWSLFISIGHILFDSLQIVMSLSVAGGILATYTIYTISRKWLSRDYSLLIVLLFYALPITNFLTNSDIKDDLAVLYIHLVIFLLLLSYMYAPPFKKKVRKQRAHKPQKAKTNSRKKVKKLLQPTKSLFKGKLSIEKQYMVLIGALSGFALGMKLTSMFVIFSILTILFYQILGKYGYLTSIILLFSLILLAGLDVPSGLWAFHLGRDWLKWCTLFLGIPILIYFFLKKSKELIQLLKYCCIYGFTILLVYLPWPIKNYTEIKELSFQIFTSGKVKEMKFEDK